MILHVRHLYQAMVLPKGKRSPVERIHVGSVPVDIREASPAEAPVAITAGFPEGRVAYRLLDDALIEPLAYEGRPLTVDALREAAEGGYLADEGLDPFGTRGGRYLTNIQGTDPGVDGAKVRSTDEGVRQSRIAQRAERLVVVDGIVHAPTQEPVYVVQRGHGGPMAKAARQTSEPRAAPSETYRADEIDHVLSGNHARGVAQGCEIEVIIPHAVRYAGPEAEIVHAAELMRGCLQKLIPDGDDELFRTYRVLRDEMKAYRDARTAGGSPDIGDLVDALRETRRPSLGIDAYWMQRAEKALDRLDARAMSQAFELVP